jgi:serine/threonine protein phosphatase PrpC
MMSLQSNVFESVKSTEGVKEKPLRCHKIGNKCSNNPYNAIAFKNKEENLYGIISGRCSLTMSHYAIEKLQELFISNRKTLNVKNTLLVTFKQMDEKIKDFFDSGGMSVMFLYYSKPFLHLAWVGNCSAFAITTKKNMIDIAPVQHTTSNDEELLRITDLHQKFKNFMLTDGEIPLINNKISVTRSIGDKNYESILISDPEYRVVDMRVDSIIKVFLASEYAQDEMEKLQEIFNTSKTTKALSKEISKIFKKKNHPVAGLLIDF